MTRALVVERLPRRRAPAPPSAPLPEPVQAALASIAGDLRHLPRDCIGDAAEMLHWLRRMAGRVDGVGRMRVAGTVPQPARNAAPPPSRNGTSLAETVFGSRATVARQKSRTLTYRKGRAVPVPIRRAREAGQMQLGL